MPQLAGGRPLRAGQKVIGSDGEVGRLDVVLVDPRSDRATGFVVRKGTLLVRDVIVPIELVRSVEQDRIILDASKAQVQRLPEYRPDEEITRDVVDALWYRSGLGPADLQFVDVHTRDGIVELTGHTHTEETKQRIEDVARRVRGVLEVRDYLDTFEALEAAVREARRAAKSRDHGARDAAAVEASA
jgi:sporulation protein YlmC with PRC-barrel domain